MAITVYREIFRLSKRQALLRLLEISVSAMIIWITVHISSRHQSEYGLGHILLQSIAFQGAALITFHLYDLIGHFRARNVSDTKMPASVRHLQQLAAPPTKDFFIILPIAGSFSAFIGLVLPFLEGGAQNIRWSNWISSLIALGFVALWIFLHRRRQNELHSNPLKKANISPPSF